MHNRLAYHLCLGLIDRERSGEGEERKEDTLDRAKSGMPTTEETYKMISF
jgi:hypothetical protein